MSGFPPLIFIGIVWLIHLPMTVKMIRQIGYAPDGQSRFGVFVRWLVPTLATVAGYVYTGYAAENFIQGYLVSGALLATGSLLWYGLYDRTALFGSRELLDNAIHARQGAGLAVGSKAGVYILGHLLVVMLFWSLAPLVQWIRK